MDETGLFYRDPGNKSYIVKGRDCHGGKRSKDRITIACCTNLLGEKEKLLVIRKSRSPRCFGKMNVKHLPVIYKHNKKAWMTSEIFLDWVNILNNKMKKEKRNVLLFIDNAPSHPKLTFSNVTLKIFPANTTSKSQPLDQGIIQAMKMKYRRRQLRHIITKIDNNPTVGGSDLLKQITVLDAIYWIARLWDEVLP